MQIAFYTIGGILVIAALVIVAGYSLPQNRKASLTIALDASRNSLWQALTNVKEYPTWRTDIKSAELKSQNDKMTWAETGKSGDTVEYQIQEQQEPEYLVTKIISEGLPYGGSWTFEIDSITENKSRLTITENGEVYNPIFRFASRFIIGHTASIDKYSQALRKLSVSRLLFSIFAARNSKTAFEKVWSLLH